MEFDKEGNLYIFSHLQFFFSFLILLKNSSRNFKEDILCLVFAFVAFVDFVCSVVTSKFLIKFDLNFLLEIICF